MQPTIERRPRVLIAEDDPEMRSLIAAALRHARCEVIEAKNGYEMLDELCSGLFNPAVDPPADLIISDLRMPGVTGLSLLAGLRSAGWHTPFILITAHDKPGLREMALRHGAASYLAKPFSGTALLQAVRGAIEPGPPS